MKDRVLWYTGVFCGDSPDAYEELDKLVRELAVSMGRSSAEVAACATDLADAFSKVKITEYEVDVLTSVLPLDDTQVPPEPLWVRNQQQKTFKRGKK